VDLIIILVLLMMQLGKLGFITFNKNLMFLTFLRNGKIFLRMRFGWLRIYRFSLANMIEWKEIEHEFNDMNAL
jgi:hypothetical protein